MQARLHAKLRLKVAWQNLKKSLPQMRCSLYWTTIYFYYSEAHLPDSPLILDLFTSVLESQACTHLSRVLWALENVDLTLNLFTRRHLARFFKDEGTLLPMSLAFRTGTGAENDFSWRRGIISRRYQTTISREAKKSLKLSDHSVQLQKGLQCIKVGAEARKNAIS